MRNRCLSTVFVFLFSAMLGACGGNDAASDQGSAQRSKQLVFSDKSTAAMASAYQPVVQELYVSYFGRPADPAGLANFDNALLAANAPTTLQGMVSAYATNPAVQSLVDAFGSSKESQALYGSGDTTAFVKAVFQNVLGRQPQQAGLDFWVNAISSGSTSQGDAALAIMAGALGNSTPQGLLDAQLINNRLAAATYFTSAVTAQNATSAYSGAVAAADARNMLGGVIASTIASAYQATVNSTITVLEKNNPGFTISGTVTGLTVGAQLVLNDNGNDALTITGNGAFTFSQPVTNGSYTVTVTNLPSGENCSVANFHGAGISSNITDVNVVCSSSGYTISGSVSGLTAGQQLTLFDNGSDSITLGTNGTFSFPTSIPFNGSYAVTVGVQPSAQYCTVSGGTGAGVTASVSSVKVVCSASNFTLGGTITGLAAGTQLALENNGGNLLAIGSNGPFYFSQGVPANGSYNVTVLTQPQNQTCTVSNGYGAGVLSNVSSVMVNCVPNNSTFTIGGYVSGLNYGSQVTLQNNGANALTLTANGAFTFSTPVALNGSYSVTVGTQPTGQTCTVSNMSGSGVVANISSVQVICSSTNYTIGGTVSGLASGAQLVLYNNNSGYLYLTSNGAFTFATPVAYGSSYSVTVGTQPTGQTCTATNGTGSNVNANVSTVKIVCSTSSYTIGAYVSGLAAGTQVTLLDNGGDPLTITANGTFSFPMQIAYQGSFAVTVGTQPVGQNCVVSGGTGSNVSSNYNVGVSCTTGSYTIGGTVTGLPTGSQITLQNTLQTTVPSTVYGNSYVQTAVINNNGSFSFPYPVAAGSSYSIALSIVPSGLSCAITNGSGSNLLSTISNVAVACSASPTIGYAYVLDTGNNMVRQFNVTASGLTATTNTIGTDLKPCAIVRHPSGKYVYVTNYGSSTISQYSVGAGGVLQALNPVHAQTSGSGPCSMVIDPAGQYAYVIDNGSTQSSLESQWIAVNVFSIGADGTLTAQPNLGISTMYSLYGFSGGSFTLTPNGQYGYLNLPGSSTPYQFSVSSGVLTALSPSWAAQNSELSYGATAFSVNPQGTFAYYAGSYNNVARYSIGANGTLTLLPEVVTGSGAPYPRGVVFSASGNYAYLMDSGDIRQFAVNADGTFTPLNPTTLYTGIAYPLVFDATGKYAFAANNYGISASQFAVGSDGTLSPMQAATLPFAFTAGPMITTGL